MVFHKWKNYQDWSLQRYLRMLLMVLQKKSWKEKYSLQSLQVSLHLFLTKNYQNTYCFGLLKIVRVSVFLNMCC